MPFRFGFQLLKRNSDRLQSDMAELQAIIAILGEVIGAPEQPVDGTVPRGHMETRLTDDGLIWTEYGTPSVVVSDAIRNGWPRDLWTDAARVSYLEANKWSPSAERNTLSQAGGRCNVPIGHINGVAIVSEDSVGLFQVNVCAWHYSREQMLDPVLNARVGYEIYKQQGWSAWQITATTLGLLEGD